MSTQIIGFFLCFPLNFARTARTHSPVFSVEWDRHFIMENTTGPVGVRVIGSSQVSQRSRPASAVAVSWRHPFPAQEEPSHPSPQSLTVTQALGHFSNLSFTKHALNFGVSGTAPHPHDASVNRVCSLHFTAAKL